jgi:hypothetical protein
MKMTIISKKPWLGAALLVLAISSLSSCLKNTGPVEDFSQSPALVSFQYTGDQAHALVTSILPGTSDSVGVEVTLSTANLTLSSPVTVTLALDQAGLDAYNAANGTTYTMLDPADYTTPANMQVTIPAGQQIVPFVLHINESLIDFSTDPALAFKIASVTGGATIATNLSSIILPIKLRNPYEGTYAVTGYFVHPAAPRAINLTKSLATISAITSQGYVGDLGSTMTFDTDPVTNVVSNMVSTVNANKGFINGVDNAVGDPNYPGPPYVHTTYNNTYDPAAHTFWLHYGYNGTPPNNFTREIYEEWVLQ